MNECGNFFMHECMNGTFKSSLEWNKAVIMKSKMKYVKENGLEF